MGNASSHPPSDSAELLVHSFQLDADFDTCQLPWICPRRNAMFHPPSSLPPSVLEFLPLEEANHLLADLNRILQETGFNPGISNPCFLFAMFFSCVLCPGLVLPMIMRPLWDEGSEDHTIPWIIVFLLFLFLPYLPFFVLACHFRRARRRRLTGYIDQWNRSGKGIKLSFGGGGTSTRGVTVGSEFGGTYDNFYMAQWDPKGLMFKGYLHVFVNTTERQLWCRNNGRSYAPPIPLGQAAYVPPAGYALVPLSDVP